MAKAKTESSQKEIVLLGLIAEEPIHAYGLEQKIRTRRIAEWADIGFSSIYRVIDGLTRKRLVQSRLVQGGQGAARKVHEITAAGKAALANGVVTFLADMTPMKMAMSVGLAFAPNGPHAEVVRCLEERATAVAKAAAEIEHYAAHFHGGPPPATGVNDKGVDRCHWLGAHLLFDHFRRHVRAEHEFLSDALRLLAAADGPSFFVHEDGAEVPKAPKSSEVKS
ncbi:MAG: helix-turn-helix transcriptional regulator [Deltaproteobacteria bacterium]|nr:helix-turn-helix transcriptional regulator [Deltaproteobacteria bacterium]